MPLSSSPSFFSPPPRRVQGLILLMVLACTCVRAQISRWESLSPGAGGQIQDIYFDPFTEGKIWLSSDVDGTYLSTDYGDSLAYVSRSLSHGMSFKVRRTNTPGGRIYQGGLYAAHYSDDEGQSWTRIEETAADAIATIAIGADDRTVLLGPSWHTKDPQKQQSAQIDPIQPLLGPRTLYLSTDGGETFTEQRYEPTDGYRQVFGAEIHPTTGTLYIGAASGVYFSTDQGQTWLRVANPDDAYRGATGGVVTSEVRKPDGTIDLNGYRYSGGCTGMAITADGSRMFAVYQTAERSWTMYTIVTDELATGNWQAISAIGTGTLPQEVQWFNPRIDPRSSDTEIKLIIGSTFLVNANRVGLYEGTVRLDGDGAVTDADWQQVLFNRGDLPWSFAQGWETVSLISRAYDYTPASWTERRIISGGGNTYFLSTDPAAAGWPFNADSWLPIYTRRNADTSAGPIPTYSDRGFSNTVTYDVASYDDYAIQANADQGILESWDRGRRWTKETFPFKASNAQSVAITYTDPPLVLADARTNSFGIPKRDRLKLMARQLTDPTTQAPKSDWRQIGGKDGGQVVNGLVNRIIQGMALDRKQPSRVYLGMLREFGIGGIWATEEIEAVYEGRTNWREISSPGMRNVFTFNDIFVDPNDSDVLWVAGGTLRRGTRNGPYDWSWENSGVPIGDLHVWDNNGTTVVGLTASLEGSPEQVYLLTDPRGEDLTDFVPAGLTVANTLDLRPESWLDPDDVVSMEGLAGYGDQIFVTTVVSRHKKGLGVFRGTIQSGAGSTSLISTKLKEKQAKKEKKPKKDKDKDKKPKKEKSSKLQEASVDGVQISWEAWSTDETGFDLYYPRDGTADAKVIRQNDGSLYYALPTFGTGVWWRYIGRDTVQPPLTVTSSSLIFSPSAGEQQQLTFTTDATWTLVGTLPDWVTVAESSGQGSGSLVFTTLTSNESAPPRRATVVLSAAGSEVEILLSQEAAPARVTFVTTPIVVDGLQEAIWNEVPTNPITVTVSGSAAGPVDSFRLAYTRERLYFIAEVTDGSPQAGDTIRFGFDASNTKGLKLKSSDFLFTIAGDGTLDGLAGEAGVQTTDAGYRYELGVAWTDLGVLPFAGSVSGVEVSVSDYTDTATPTVVRQYFGNVDLTAENPSLWGEARLTGTDLPWFEDFPQPEFTQVDTGLTAWSLDLSATDMEGDDAKYVHVEKGALKGRHLDGEGVWLSEVIDIRTADYVRVSLDAQETGPNGGNNGYLKLAVIVDGGPELLVDELVGDAPVDGQFYELSADGLRGSSLQLVVRMNNSTGGTNHSIDNVLVDFGAEAVCTTPSELSVVRLTDTKATLQWVMETEGLARYTVGYRVAGSGAELTELTVDDAAEVTIDSLMPATEYEWRVSRRCPTETSSPVLGPVFRTLNAIIREDIYFETFDLAGCTVGATTVADYACYAEPTISYSGEGELNDLRNFGTYTDASGGYHLFAGGGGQVFNATGINTATYDNLQFSLAVLKNSRFDAGEGLIVEFLDGSSVVGEMTVDLPVGEESNSTWYLVEAAVADFLPVTANFGYRITTPDATRFRIDDIRLRGQLRCDAPEGVTVSEVSQQAATLNWTEVAGAAAYTVAIAEIGNELSAGQAVSGTPFTFTDLLPGTEYVYSIRTNCSATSSSAAIDGNFTTAAGEPAVPFLETHEREGCTDATQAIAAYSCYSAPEVAHFGEGIVNSSAGSTGYADASGGEHIFLRGGGESYTLAGIDATVFTDPVLNFGVRKNSRTDDGSTLNVEVSYDGGVSWDGLPVLLPTTTESNSTWYRVDLFLNQTGTADVHLRFTATANIRYRIDDIGLGNAASESLSAPDRSIRQSSERTLTAARLYPNPVDNRIELQLAAPVAEIECYIFDVFGRQLIYRGPRPEATDRISIELPDLPAGLYYLQTTASGERAIYEFIKR